MENKVFTLGIIGAGVMGKGIAERFAVHGHRAILLDNSAEALANAPTAIKRSLSVSRMMGKSPDIPGIMQRITCSSHYGDLAQADFVIETVSEKAGIKETVYRKLEEAVHANCIFVSNTSCIPITELASFTDRPDRVIGAHFMNPAQVKNFAEVIKGHHTSEGTVTALKELLASAGIECEVINDSPGFVSNRLSHLFMNEAAFMVHEGIADPGQVDNIFKKGYGHSMGPLETADLIGLDTVTDSLRILYERYEDPKFRVCPLLKKMVTAGLNGKKSGQGFYGY